MKFKLKRFETALTVSRIANIHYFEFAKQYHTFKDTHPFRELLYVDSGFINAQSESFCGKISENQLIIHRADEVHSLSCPENDAADVIIIGFECTCPELDSFSSFPATLSDGQKRLLTEIIKEGRSVFMPPYDVPNQKDMKKRRDYPFGADQMIKIKIEALLIELVRERSGVASIESDEISDDKIREIKLYLQNNFKEKIRLSEICFLFGTNKTTLCQTFRKASGETVISFVNRLKIKEAKRLMRSGNYNLTEISEIVGFSTVHYFSRIFKQYENQSPTSYIKTVKSRLML